MAVQSQAALQPDRRRLVLEPAGKTEKLDRARADRLGRDHVDRRRTGTGLDRCGM
jgi:hypothetical protein